jgi:uncharacterized protein (TIGR02246 family)
MRGLMVSLVVVSLFSSFARAADEQQEIKNCVNDFKSAWDKDDAKAMSMVWTEDATLINPFGRVAKGREEMEKVFVDEHSSIFKNTKYQVDEMTIQMISPDTALVDLSSKITGMKGPDGSDKPDFVHHVAMVFVKKGDHWMGAAARPYQFSSKPGEAK